MTGRPGRILWAGIAVVALLSACSDDAPPAPSPSLPAPSASDAGSTPAGSASPTSSAAASVPPLPPEARAETSQGAAAFARYWFEVSDYAYATGDRSRLKEFSQQECVSCKSVVEEIESRHASGATFEGVDITVRSAEAAPPDERGIVVTLVLDESPSRVIGADGSVIEEAAGSSGVAVNLYAVRANDAWKVFGIGAVS
jgi:hypothetical protein